MIPPLFSYTVPYLSAVSGYNHKNYNHCYFDGEGVNIKK